GQRESDGVRKSERQIERRAFDFGAITGAAELERARIALGGALHHGGDEGADEALHARRVAPGEARFDRHLAVGDGDVDARRDRTSELALRTFDADLPVFDGDVHALGHKDGALADARLRNPTFRSRNRGVHHHTSQRSSPPTFRRRASLSLITPRDVLRMATPMPDRTRGIGSCRTY